MTPVVHAQTSEDDDSQTIELIEIKGETINVATGSGGTQDISFTTTLEGKNMANQINVLTNNTTVISNSLTNVSEDVQSLKSSVNNATSSVAELKGTVTELSSTVDTKADKTTVTDIDTRVTTNKNDIATLRTTTEENLKLKADNSTVTALDTRVKTAENDIDALEAEQDEQDTKINNITSGTTYTGTGLETAVRNTATSVFDTSLDTAIASGGRIYNFTNQQITNAVERNGAIYNFTYDTLEAEVGDRGIIKEAIDDTISTELGESGVKQQVLSEKLNCCKAHFTGYRQYEAQFVLQIDTFLQANLEDYYTALTDWVTQILIP